MDTTGYGGKNITEYAKIQTNDKSQPELTLTVVAFVEEFALISPKRVTLSGHVGETIESRVTVKPVPKYPFKIVGAQAKDGRFIKYRLEDSNDPKNIGFIMSIENTKWDPGRFMDTIFLKTDSSIRPEIPILIFGNILKRK